MRVVTDRSHLRALFVLFSVLFPLVCAFRLVLTAARALTCPRAHCSRALCRHAGKHQNAHIKCCAKQKAVYNSNGRLDHYECQKCDSGFTPSDNKELCMSKVGSTCKLGEGPTPDYFPGKQKCVKCSDRGCSRCSNVFYDCIKYVVVPGIGYGILLSFQFSLCIALSLSRCKNGYSLVGGDCTKLVF